MLNRERVINTIKHKDVDRMPIYGWLFNEEFAPKVAKEYGSIRNFEDKYDFDLAHLFCEAMPHDFNEVEKIRKTIGEIEPENALQLEFCDVNQMSKYASLKNEIDYYKGEKGRFVYIQTPGCFEYFNAIFGIEDHLTYLLLYPDELALLYERLSDWTVEYINNCIDIGGDMIHISDDWGSQNSLMFSPDIWKSLIYPYHKRISEAVKKRNAFLSLHSDGNVMSVLDGLVDIGYDVVHPFQKGAGMDYDVFQKQYMDKFVILGGLDVQSTIGFGDYERLTREIEELFARFKKGGMLLCTTHMIQPHCSIEELEYAYQLITKLNK